MQYHSGGLLPPAIARFPYGILAAVFLIVSPLIFVQYSSLWPLDGAPTPVPQLLWLLRYHRLPGIDHLAILALLFGSVLLWNRPWCARWMPWTSGVLFVALLTWAPIDNVNFMLGDGHWRNLEASDTRALASSILANVIYVLTLSTPLPREFISVAAGIASALAYIWTLRSLVATSDAPHGNIVRMGVLVAIASGLPLIFVRGYHEITCIGVPFLVLSLGCMIRYLNEEGPKWLFAGTALLVVAALTHGQNSYLLPLIPFAILLRGQSWKSAAVAGGICAGIAVATYVASVGLTRALGFVIEPGDIYGGGDNDMFVAFTRAGLGPYGRFTFLSPDHLMQTMNILFFVLPFFPVVGLLMARDLWRRAGTPGESISIFLAIAALGYIAFILLFHFDLRPPSDTDLMIAMGTPLLLCAATVLANQRRQWIGVALCAAGTIASWTVIGAFLTP